MPIGTITDALKRLELTVAFLQRHSFQRLVSLCGGYRERETNLDNSSCKNLALRQSGNEAVMRIFYFTPFGLSISIPSLIYPESGPGGSSLLIVALSFLYKTTT
jgi:hypothetical protein